MRSSGENAWMTEEALTAQYGIIKIDPKRRINLYVFDRKIDIPLTGRLDLHSTLSDGRDVIGAVYLRENLTTRIFRKVGRKRTAAHIDVREDIELTDEIDAATYEKIKDELLTQRCETCRAPTRYNVQFTKERFRDTLEIDTDLTQHNSFACVDHLNEIIEKHDTHDWDVTAHHSLYRFSDAKWLGRVVYDASRRAFARTIYHPTIVQKSPDVQIAMNGDHIIYRYNAKTGLLEIGDVYIAEILLERITPDRIPPEGVDIGLDMEPGEKVKLFGVKEIRQIY